MNTKFLTMARRLFNSELVPASTNRANRIKWARSIRALGDNWKLAKPVGRLT